MLIFKSDFVVHLYLTLSVPCLELENYVTKLLFLSCNSFYVAIDMA